MINMISIKPISEDEAATIAVRIIGRVKKGANRDLSKIEVGIIKGLSFFFKEEYLQEKSWHISQNNVKTSVQWLRTLNKKCLRKIADELGLTLKKFNFVLGFIAQGAIGGFEDFVR